jgi:ABC-2 type transport system ATP-binding protein
LTGSKALVSLRNVSKVYGQFRALDNVSFNINEGETFGYIGPNGAGKTTTMRILVGLISDFQGDVSIDGYQLPERKGEVYKLLGYLPQNVAFQEWRTVDQALKTFGKLSGLSVSEVDTRIPEILEVMGLSDVRHKPISKLSGGMTQKVGLAQALIHRPKLLVLDEPLGGLDPLSRHQFKELVLKLGREGATILFSSHILSDVQDVADRIGIINFGKVKQIGSLSELKQHFSNRRAIEVLLSSATDKWQKLSAVEGVKTAEQPSPGRIVLALQSQIDADEAIDAIVKAVVKLGIRVRGISLLSPSLDEIYLNYIRESENH